MRVLIAEGGSHYKILEQIYRLLAGKCDLTFYLIDNKRYDHKEFFPSISKAKVIRAKFRGILFFAGLLFRGARYDIINISTGPDGDHYIELFRIICFYLCCVIYRRKLIFTFRNLEAYLPSTPGLKSYIRYRSIRHLKRFTFETRTMRNAFIEGTGDKDALVTESYDRYADVTIPKRRTAASFARNGKVRIGLLGTINEARRDYGALCEAIGNLAPDKRSRLVFVTLGACLGEKNQEIVRRIANLVEVESCDGFLSEGQFIERGISCDLLISPLTDKKAYGTLKGSGSFGDVVYLRKKLIFPSFVDPEREFEDACIYYSSSDDLTRVFLDVDEHLSHKIPTKFFERFSTGTVFEAITTDLKLC